MQIRLRRLSETGRKNGLISSSLHAIRADHCEKLSLQGWSRDLSESGVGAFVAEALILSESVILEIPLPDCDKQVIPAKVVRALGTEYGFQFTALSAEQRRQIRAALKERPAIPRHCAGQ